MKDKVEYHNFKKLNNWVLGLELCDHVYSFTETLPNKEKYNLISQMERSAVSIPSNIAEGSAKRTNNHFAEFLSTALASSYELETQLLICEKRNFGNINDRSILLSEVSSLQTKFFNFRNKIINDNYTAKGS
ncbi:MAG: four helix bundle protein [Bacteroidota bacterium]